MLHIPEDQSQSLMPCLNSTLEVTEGLLLGIFRKVGCTMHAEDAAENCAKSKLDRPSGHCSMLHSEVSTTTACSIPVRAARAAARSSDNC